MVIINLFGGLGNQMFQYAVGRNMSILLNTELTYQYNYNRIRKDFNPNDIIAIYNVFNIRARELTSIEQKNLTSKKIKFIASKILNFNIENRKYFINRVDENSFNFDPDVLKKKGNILLNGYWQTEKYFESHKDIIRDDFTFKIPFNEESKIIANKIINTNSVSIHIRGQDYINRLNTSKTHNVCNMEYYQRAIDEIMNSLVDPYFFIFSDDYEYAKSIISFNIPHEIVNINKWNDSPYDDMRLMSICKHNIIANSSFSWWGAWLNNNKDKIIISPKTWTNENFLNAKDIIPKNWIKI